jgi:putative alpha-1,2-mannosidase
MLLLIFLFGSLFQLALNKPDLQIGAGGFGFGCGSNSPAAQVPYSFVRLGPDTAPLLKKEYFKFQHFGGYNTADLYVRAFSHLHLVGAGVLDMGIFGILPMKSHDKKPTIPGDNKVLFFKESEFAEPGYYRVDLEDQTTV